MDRWKLLQPRGIRINWHVGQEKFSRLVPQSSADDDLLFLHLHLADGAGIRAMKIIAQASFQLLLLRMLRIAPGLQFLFALSRRAKLQRAELKRHARSGPEVEPQRAHLPACGLKQRLQIDGASGPPLTEAQPLDLE